MKGFLIALKTAIKKDPPPTSLRKCAIDLKVIEKLKEQQLNKIHTQPLTLTLLITQYRVKQKTKQMQIPIEILVCLRLIRIKRWKNISVGCIYKACKLFRRRAVTIIEKKK